MKPVTVEQFIKDYDRQIDLLSKSFSDRRLIITLIEGAYVAGQHHKLNQLTN